MGEPLLWIAAAGLSYLVGALPFSAWIARWRGVEIQAVGSGNPGATNVTRSLGPLFGVLALLGDVGKGLAAVGACAALGAPLGWAALAVIGHDWSVFLRLRGGKGVATTLGVLLGSAWLAGLLTLGVWLAVTGLTRKVSLGSLAALIGAPWILWGLGEPAERVGVFAGLALLGVIRHRSNLKRLWRGEELSPLSKRGESR